MNLKIDLCKLSDVKKRGKIFLIEQMCIDMRGNIKNLYNLEPWGEGEWRKMTFEEIITNRFLSFMRNIIYRFKKLSKLPNG